MSAIASNTVRPAIGKTPVALAQLLGARWEAIVRYFVRRAAIATLREFDDRALRDIGVERTDIEAAVYGLVTPLGQERIS
jgi:uncharacterized protein YjiS (DUF1127 family)